jgi:hypothetical protein
MPKVWTERQRGISSAVSGGGRRRNARPNKRDQGERATRSCTLA